VPCHERRRVAARRRRRAGAWGLLALFLWAAPSAAATLDLVDTTDLRVRLSDRQGIRIRVRPPDLRFRIGGRLHLDASFFDEDRARFDDGFHVRRGRAYLWMSFGERWSAKVERELTSRRAGWRNVWLRYRPSSSVAVQAGNFIAPFSLASVASSNDQVFAERPLPTIIAPSYQTGLGIRTRGRTSLLADHGRWTWALAGYIESFGDAQNDRHRSGHTGVATRGTFAPVSGHRRLAQIGASFDYESLDAKSRFRLSSRPEAGSGPSLLNTGRLSGVDRAISVGVEGAGLLGPFWLEGEYLQTWLARPDRPDPTFHGWYVQAGYLLTGESRRAVRSTAVLGSVRPRHRLGALGVATRYSTVDLDDETVTGGHAHAFSVGLAWYLRENVRLVADYVRVRAIDSRQRPDDPRIVQLRFVLFF